MRWCRRKAYWSCLHNLPIILYDWLEFKRGVSHLSPHPCSAHSPGIVKIGRSHHLTKLSVFLRVSLEVGSLGGKESNSVGDIIGISLVAGDFGGVKKRVIHHAPFIAREPIRPLIHFPIGHLGRSDLIDIGKKPVDVGFDRVLVEFSVRSLIVRRQKMQGRGGIIDLLLGFSLRFLRA